MKRQLNGMRIAKKAILVLSLCVFIFSSVSCHAFAEYSGMVGALNWIEQAAGTSVPKETPSSNTSAPMITPMKMPVDTPTPKFTMEAPVDTPVVPTESPEAESTETAEDTPMRKDVRGDESVHKLEKQPNTVSPTVRLYSRSKWWNNLHLNRAKLSIPTDGMPIPQIYQYNYTTTVCFSGNSERSARTSGCGATVVSMIDAYINGNYDQTPYTVLYDAAESGTYAGKGLDYYTVLALVKARGVNAECRKRSVDSMRAELEAGHPLILRMGPGTFTKAGHYIIVRGLDANGDALVNDPNSEEHSNMPFSLELLNRETKADDMFVILSEPCAST